MNRALLAKLSPGLKLSAGQTCWCSLGAAQCPISASPPTSPQPLVAPWQSHIPAGDRLSAPCPCPSGCREAFCIGRASCWDGCEHPALPANHLKPSAPSPHLRTHPGPNPRHPRQPPNPAGPAAVAAHLGLDLPPEGDPIVLQTRERSWLQAARKGWLSQPGNRGTQRGCAQAHQTCLAAGLGRRCREELQHKAPG